MIESASSRSLFRNTPPHPTISTQPPNLSFSRCVGRELTDEDVRTAIKNSGGIKGSLLIPEAPFELLVRRAIDKLLPPALQVRGLRRCGCGEGGSGLVGWARGRRAGRGLCGARASPDRAACCSHWRQLAQLIPAASNAKGCWQTEPLSCVMLNRPFVKSRREAGRWWKAPPCPAPTTVQCSTMQCSAVSLIARPPFPGPPAAQCKDFVHSELLRLAAQANPRDIQRFPLLQVGPRARSLPACTCV